MIQGGLAAAPPPPPSRVPGAMKLFTGTGGEVVSSFDSLDTWAKEQLGTAVQIPDLMMNLTLALSEHHGDLDAAATDDVMVRNWVGVAFETRSAVLLMLAWGSKEAALTVSDDKAGLYAAFLHSSARSFDGEVEEFQGPTFPRLPFPGQAGALASWIGFDHGDEAGLKAALILMSLMQQRMDRFSSYDFR